MVRHARSTNVEDHIRLEVTADAFFLPVDPCIGILRKRKKLGDKEKKATYKQGKRDKAPAAKKDRKKAAIGKKVVSEVLDSMICPRIVQCDKIDLQLKT